ncbi:hypothetical protein E4Q08_14350 [Candidatus Accumulibacter phosphatis]|uniref:Uncharacterized protein n=1 Tax=Candidatus Accumulibacter contiguus TaxID=2954381 RepID=A0ABX1T9J0_9PROT|nr:hypothetical protein [Candidatus Accumulibacter contiguus]NMQ06350.1 hypothetical protein [Candidatus Accumulibacter contiguus]
MDDVDPLSMIVNRVNCCKKTVVTYLHGIGTYSPFIFTDELKVFDQRQADYYSSLNDIKKIEIYDFATKRNSDNAQSQVTPKAVIFLFATYEVQRHNCSRRKAGFTGARQNMPS